MTKRKIKEKGIVLFIVLATIFIVILLASILLGIMSSQSRLTHHKTSRIQAYYAAMAGINYALEMIKSNNSDWIPSPDTVPNTRTRTLCRTCVAPEVNEPDLPISIQQITITIGASGSGISGTRAVSATATYTYTP